MLVYAAEETPRLFYILDHILKFRLGIEYKVTDNPDYFIASRTPKINYGQDIIEGCINIPSAGLLFEKDIFKQNLSVETHKDWNKLFYKRVYNLIPDFRTDTVYLPFDLFAASFYLLSRYEEYLPSQKDEHNRFQYENSLAWSNNFLKIPLVDIWIEQLGIKINKQYPHIKPLSGSFKQINSIDIDFIYKYKGHSLYTRLKKFAGSVLRGKTDINYLKQGSEDPYDTYDFLHSSAFGSAETLFFILLADYGGHDKNHSPHSHPFKSLISSLAQLGTIGIHPGYRASVDYKTMQREFTLFKQLTGKPPSHSRFHFLKIRIPESYNQLYEAGIVNDYTMAYPDQTGFRASTCHPFLFFNLKSNHVVPVHLYPSCVMDVTLKNYMKLSPGEAIDEINYLKGITKKAGGNFISIWHNSSFDPEEGWKSWDSVYLSLFN